MCDRTSIKLSDIVLDLSFQHRCVNENAVSEYRQKIRAGCDLGPLTILHGSNKIISGWHRIAAHFLYRKEMGLGTDYEVPCVCKDFTDALEIWKYAVAENMKIGYPLTVFNKTYIIQKMTKMGASIESLAEILFVAVSRIKKLGDRFIVVSDAATTLPVIPLDTPPPDGHKYLVCENERPIKYGQEHRIGETITSNEYEKGIGSARGIPVWKQANELCRWLNQSMVDVNDTTTMVALRSLHTTLGQFLEYHTSLIERATSQE